MKRNNFKKITIMLAAAVVSGAIGGVLASPITADAAAKTYALSDVFAAKNGTVEKSDSKVTQFNLSNGGSAYIKRDVAFKWFENKAEASYFSTSFTLTDDNFSSVTLAVDSPSAWATKDNKATNEVTFEKTSGGLEIYVNKSEAAANTANTENVAAATVSDYLNKKITVSLSDVGCEYGQYKVLIDVNGAVTLNDGQDADDDYISRFVNVGQSYVEYSSSNSVYPLTIKVDVPDDTATEEAEQTKILFHELNKQSFENVTDENKVTDTAPAVLVLKEEFSGFRLGTNFALSYDTVDVLAKSNEVKATPEYYQYNPAHTEITYKSLNTSTVFMETQMPNETPATTVFKKYNGKEFVSVRFTLSDGSFIEDNNDNNLQKPVYDLYWYATAEAQIADNFVPEVGTAEQPKYVLLDRNESAPIYSHIELDDTNKTNKIDTANQAAFDAAVEVFQGKVDKEANGKYAGDKEDFALADLDKLISDNDGYRNMKFTVSYYTPNSSAAESVTGSYNGLEIPVASVGIYQFKVFAQDKSGNQMKYYIDGELQTVTVANVWDIEEIPTFTFEVAKRQLKVEDSGSTVGKIDKEVLDTTYSLTSFDVSGEESLSEDYVLYKLKEGDFNALGVKRDFNSVSFETLKDKIDGALAGSSWTAVLNGKTYQEFYLSLYCELLADGDTALADKIYACFEKVGVQGDHVNNADDRWEKYEWNPDAKTFKTVEAGKYFIFADLWENNMPARRVTAYKVIEVSDKIDEIAGVNDWIENNLVSVILFAVAGVMLILIIVLLLIKPSDETLEDVSEKAAKEKTKKKEKKD